MAHQLNHAISRPVGNLESEMVSAAEWAEIQKSLEDDIPQVSQPFPLLAHYTTLDTLERILSSNELWFSHPLLMNDKEEVVAGIVTADNLIKLSDDLKDALGAEGFAKFYQRIETNIMFHGRFHLFNTYILCLSEHDIRDSDGALSMWRGYGGNGAGAALVFDISKLEVGNEAPIVVSPVQYVTQNDRQDWIERLIRKLIVIIKSVKFSGNEMDGFCDMIFERIKMAAIFSKHKGFSEEKEWRAVYLPERDKPVMPDNPFGPDNPMRFAKFFSYHNGPRGLEPKLKLNLALNNGWTRPGTSLETMINRVILGPSRASDLVEPTARRMLEKVGKPTIPLVASKIPFRGGS